LKYVEKITNGQWTTETAGGCANNRATYSINPVYQLEVNGPREQENMLLIDLKGPKEYSVGFDVRTISVADQSSSKYFDRVSSGSYRSGFTMLKINEVPRGTYNIIPSTFYPGQKGPYFLTVKSSCPIKLTRLR